jgi:ubiquitin-conjugating enzyme E2 W
MFKKRLQKELAEFVKRPPMGFALQSDNLNVWKVAMEGQGIYSNESFVLQFTFTDSYPMECPDVVFITPSPIHPHIYSNGHICLNILYNEWTPALTVSAVCLSIQSMLCSCTEKSLPPDNDQYVAVASKSPKRAQWDFHDDRV